jgi:hypothetical protein
MARDDVAIAGTRSNGKAESKALARDFSIT